VTTVERNAAVNALTLALARLQRRGWCQHQYSGPRGFSIIGSLDKEHISLCRPLLKQAIQNTWGETWNVNQWEDVKGRKFDEIEQVLIDAIQLAGGQ